MSRRALIATTFLIAAGALLLLSSGDAVSQRIAQVFVTNLPAVQQIRGDVDLIKPVRLATTVGFEEIIVPPVQRSETTRFVEAGRLVTEGFPSVVLSLHGEVRGTVQRPGSVGVILLPEQKTIQEAFNEQGQLHFALETVATGITSRTPYFASQQPRYLVGFSAYRVLLYNTTDKTVTANLYAYLTQ